MNRKKGIRVLALALVLALMTSMTAWAATDACNADRLYNLGLFRGTGSGYALESTATRMQGIIMLTRLLGEEKAALSYTGECPFTDVTDANSKLYAGYAYEKGYTNGTTDTTFSPGSLISFKHYVTFLLRALGYDDSAGDFTFQTSLTKAASIGLMTSASATTINSNNPTFYRKDLVDLSVSALTTKLKGSSSTLAEALVARGVFTKAQGTAQGVIGGTHKAYSYKALTKTAGEPVTRVTKTYSVASGKVTADVITVDISNPNVTVKSAMVNNRLGATANFSDIVASSGAKVVVNGNFFDAYGTSKFPIGYVMVNGHFLYGVSGITSFGFSDNAVYVGKPSVFFYITTDSGTSWACYEANSSAQGSALSVLYSQSYGKKVAITADGYVMGIKGGKIISYQAVKKGASVDIPTNGYLAYMGTGFASTDYFKTPVVGTKVTVEARQRAIDDNGFITANVKSIVSGAPRLVEKGKICTTLEPGFTEERFTSAVTPRTAVGKLSDGRLVIVSTSSASIQQMRELMLQLGCVDAVNLDGGASTALAWNGTVVRNAGRQLTTTLQVFVK